MTLRRALKRLRLKNGDILLVQRDSMISIDELMQVKVNRLDFPVPIVFVDGKNGIQRLPFETLEQIYLEAKSVRA